MGAARLPRGRCQPIPKKWGQQQSEGQLQGGGGQEKGSAAASAPADKPRSPARTLGGWARSGVGGTPTSPKVPSRGYGGSIEGTHGCPPRPGIAFLWGGGVRGRPPPRQPNGCAGGISSRSLRSALPAPGGSPGKRGKRVVGGGDGTPDLTLETMRGSPCSSPPRSVKPHGAPP